jgi:beta-glucosidase
MKEVYRDSSRSARERTEDLLQRMTLEEKVAQMCQVNLEHDPELWIKERGIGSYLNITSEECLKLQEMALKTRLGIPLLLGIDAVHGHAFYNGATVFPTQLGLSSSWNPPLIEQVARITAKEVIRTGYNWTFSPVLCMGRDPRWGRINETFGEDPCLIGVMAQAMIRGYQGEDLSCPDSILACAKHFIAYGESTGGRDSAEAEVTRRKLKSLFFPPFKSACDAKCGSFMSAYHSIDGVPCSANQWLLRDVLKNEWDFRGIVVTDWKNLSYLYELQKVAPGWAEAAKIALNAGNDMMMMGPDFFDNIIQEYHSGEIDEKLINDSLRRILNIKFKLGLFDGKAITKKPSDINIIGCDAHRKVALEAALQSIVLLKNHNNTLPIKEDIGSITVTGPNADSFVGQLGDWSFIEANTGNDSPVYESHKAATVTVLESIKRRVNGKSTVRYTKGCDIYNPEDRSINEAVNAAKDSKLIIAVVGDSHKLNGEQKDRASLDLTGAQQELLKALKATGKPLVIVLLNGKPLTIPWIAENADAIIEAWNPGLEGGNAIASIIFGDYNPCGKLTISFPRHVGQIPVYYNQLPGWHGEERYIDLEPGPLFAFGFGLSYTTYQYDNLKVSKKELKTDESLTVTVDVKNTGEREGIEIVQLYVNDMFSSCVTPIKQLKRFRRVKLKPGEKKSVEFHLPVSELTMINACEQEVIEPGEFEVMVGSSSRDMDLLKTQFYVK